MTFRPRIVELEPGKPFAWLSETREHDAGRQFVRSCSAHRRAIRTVAGQDARMANDKTVLVTGATGKQGGAVARRLLERGHRVRAMTRKPDSDGARELGKLGATIVVGDLDDAKSVGTALAGAWGVWAVQNSWEAGVEKEEEQGKRIAKLAREQGVQHYVYSSVGSAHRKTGIPHFDNKARVEDTVRALKFPSYVILRPVYFMENLLAPWSLQGDKLMAALQPTTKLQMIAVEDIGQLGALAFDKAAEMNGKEIDFAGDAITMPEAAAILSEVMGKPITFQQQPIDAVRAQSEDTAIMLEWFDKVGYNADIEGVQRQYGVKFLRLRDWARKNVKR
ncbi:MAG: NmrA family protein [Myxococcales bacterium]|nr:NmrA family protein [Myxococcales bacterium]